MLVAFMVNPLAGYGGKLNNKGSDNLILDNIKNSVSIQKAIEFIGKINTDNVDFLVPSGSMGSDILDIFKIKYKIVWNSSNPTTAKDTENFVKNSSGASFLCFVGGDGTARDILNAQCRIPVLAVPSGVKMYSSIFAMNINHAAEIFNKIISGNITFKKAEISDIDEEKYRNGILDIKTFGSMDIPDIDGIVNSSKAEYPSSSAYDMAEYIIDTMKNDFYYVIGPGSTCKSIVSALGYKSNMLGFDIFYGKKLVLSDMDESTIFKYVNSKPSFLIISFIGGQGFLLGRGNQQISSRVLKSIGFNNIVVLSSPEKLADIKTLYLDINSDGIEIPKYIKVLTGYGIFKLIKLEF